MNKLEIKGEGNTIKGKLKQAQAKLANNKVLSIKGKSQELFGRAQKEAGGIRAAIKKSATGRCE